MVRDFILQLDEGRLLGKVAKVEQKFKKYASLKPDNYSEACKVDPQCSVGCDVCCNLPYNVKTGNTLIIMSADSMLTSRQACGPSTDS